MPPTLDPAPVAVGMNRSSPDRYPWQLLALLWGCFFLHQGDRQVFNAVIPLIRADLGLSDVQVGLVATIFTLVYGLLVPGAGYLGDICQKRWVVLASLLTFSFGTLLTGLAGGMLLLIVFRSVATGGGEAIYYPAASSLIGQYHRATRALGMAVHQSAAYLGIVGSGWVAGLIGQKFGWRSAFLGFGVAGLLWAGLVGSSLRNDRADATADGSPAGPPGTSPRLGEALGYILRRPTFYLLSGAFGGLVFVNIGYTTWMPTFLYEKFHLSLASAGFHSTFLHFLAAFFGVMTGARFADRWASRRPTVRLEVEILGLLGGAPFIALLAGGKSLPVVYTGLALFGLFRGFYDSNLFAVLFDVIEPRYRSTATGLMLCGAFVVGSLAPLVLGWIKKTSSLDHGLFFLAFVFAAAGVLLVAARVFTFRRDYHLETS